MNINRRISGYIKRSRQLAPLLTPPASAPLFFVSRHFMPKILFRGKYGGRVFYARNVDYSAIREIFFEQDYEYLVPLLQKKEHLSILDIGAHIGIFSLWMLKINPNLKILSIEASPETYSILSKTVQLAAQKKSPAWRCMHRAAWKNNETISFANSGDAMSHQVSEKGDQKVQGIPLSELISEYDEQKIDLMKVDIEGAEEAFLCASPELLKNIDRLVVELHDKYCDTKRVRALLEGTYQHISEVQGRASSKVVLYCRHSIDE